MKGSVRFVHASDLHLDATFGGVDATDDRVSGALARSTFEALDRVIDLCIDRSADFLVIAGDLHNSADRSLRAELAFQRAMMRMDEAGIPVFLVHGNHDPRDGWSAGLELPPSVKIFPADRVARFEVERDGDVACAVYGRSFATREVTDNLARGFSRRTGDPLALAVLHANVGQREGHDNYAPCSVEDLRSAGMDYWALGHIHVPGRVSDHPPAVYPGSTQGLDPTEEGPRGCLFVELDGDGAVEEFVSTASVLWRRVELPSAEITGLDGLRTAIRELCQNLREAGAGRPVIARIDLTGRSPIHGALLRPGVMRDLVADIRDEQLGLDPWLWIDRVRDRTRPAVALEEVLAEEGLRGDIARLAGARMEDQAAAHSLLAEIIDPVLDQLAARPETISSPEEIVALARDLCIDLVSEDDL